MLVFYNLWMLLCKRGIERCIRQRSFLWLLFVELSEEKSKPKHLRKACLATPRKWQGWWEFPKGEMLVPSFAEQPSISWMPSLPVIPLLEPDPVSLMRWFSLTCKDHINYSNVCHIRENYYHSFSGIGIMQMNLICVVFPPPYIIIIINGANKLERHQGSQNALLIILKT